MSASIAPKPGCHCEACEPNTPPNMRMVICEICGSKRCPHATNHIFACTGSNASGQPGSSYGVPYVPASPNEWINIKDRLPDNWQACDWLFPPSELKRERWILCGECILTASVPGDATHWRPAAPLPDLTPEDSK